MEQDFKEYNEDVSNALWRDSNDGEITTLRQRVQELEKLRKENKQLQTSFDAQCVSADKLFDECAELRQRVAELEADLELAKHNNEAHDRELERVIAERDELQEANRIACEDLVERHDRIAGLAAERDKATQYWKIAEGRCDALKQQRDELVADIERCYRMLLSEPDTQGALFKAENILREAIASVKEK